MNTRDEFESRLVWLGLGCACLAMVLAVAVAVVPEDWLPAASFAAPGTAFKGNVAAGLLSEHLSKQCRRLFQDLDGTTKQELGIEWMKHEVTTEQLEREMLRVAHELSQP